MHSRLQLLVLLTLLGLHQKCLADKPLAAVSSGPPVAVPQKQSLADIIEATEQSVVRIDAETIDGKSQGSGFLIQPGIIVTNVHVLAGATTANVILPNGQIFRIEGTLFVDAERDIAIAKLTGSAALGVPILQLSGRTPRKGDHVIALGSPLGLSFTATSGVVSAVRPAEEISKEMGLKLAGTWVQIDAALSAGNSGGPIIDDEGQVVAMSTLASKTAQNLNFGISAADMRTALQNSNARPVAPLSEIASKPKTAKRNPGKNDPPKEFEHPIAGKLVLLPSGEFTMGAADSDPEATLNEQPAHKIKIDASFYIGAYEITVAQFRQFVAATGYRTEAERDGVGGWGYNQTTRRFAREGLRYTWKETGFEQKGQHPVVNVSWNDTVAFCEWLSGKDGTRTFRLPTEAEWEYAARGGTTTIYSHGESRTKLIGKENVADKSLVLILVREPAELNLINQAAPWVDRFPFAAEVGSFKPNPFGLYDMHGNVTEWVEDWYDEEKYVKGGATPPKKGTLKVYRGGSWAYGPANARSTVRHRFPRSERWCHLGFRIVAEVPK